MQALALPNEPAAWAPAAGNACDNPSPSAPRPPTCSKSRRVSPSHSFRLVPRIRSMESRVTDPPGGNNAGELPFGPAFFHDHAVAPVVKLDQRHKAPHEHEPPAR